MNTKVIGVIAALILLLVAGGAYFLSQNKTTSPTTDSSKEQTTTESKSSSLLDLLSSGKSQRCTFKTTTSTGLTEGTFYIASTKVRGDIKTTVNAKTQEMSLIRDGDMNYIWGSSLGSNTGIKMKVSLEDVSKNQQASGFIDPSNKLDYNCMPWTTDASLFTPPANIKFTDMTSLVAPKATGTTTNTQESTSYCDEITDAAAKAACLKAISGQ